MRGSKQPPRGWGGGRTNGVGHKHAQTTAERLEEGQYDLAASGGRLRRSRRLYGSAAPLRMTRGRDLR